jgi:hypothetical protein
MSRFVIQQARVNEVLYPGIAGWVANPAPEINSDALDGVVHETAHHVMRTAPTADLTTRNLAIISALTGSTDAPILALDGTNGLELIGGKANSLAPDYLSGSVHVCRKMAHGVLVFTDLSWSKGGKAEVKLKGYGTSADGTTAAMTATAVALPTAPVPDYGYILSALTLNGSVVRTVESLNITCDPRAAHEYQAGLPEPVDVSMAPVNGPVQWRLNASIGDCDTGSGTGAVVAVFTRLTTGGGLGSATLTFTFNANWSQEESLGGQAGGSMTRALIVRPRLSGSTKPVAWAVA